MIPLHDDNPTATTPIVTVGIIAICVVVFLWQLGLDPRAEQRMILAWGLVPSVLLGGRDVPASLNAPMAELTIVSSMFLHGGFMHLAGNMLYLWIFGNNVEDAMGHARFVVFYLLSGLAAAMAQALADPSSTVPIIGASGAIGGVLGAYLVLHPKARVLVLIPLGLFSRTVRVPAVVVLGLWFVLQLVMAGAARPGGGGVAYLAHIGGFVAGAVLIFVFRRPGVALFDRRPRDYGGPWG